MDCTPVFKKVKTASRSLNLLETDVVNKILLMVADAVIENSEFILSENEKDLVLMDKSNPNYDRLLLTTERINTYCF